MVEHVVFFYTFAVCAPKSQLKELRGYELENWMLRFLS